MTFTNLAKWSQIIPGNLHPCWFYTKVLMRDEAQNKFTFGQDMLTFINEKPKPEFIRILDTFTSRANGN